MNEKPLERLNYYNGRPLDAADLKTEQEYHIRTRRWLNKSLYSAGIARGLEVRKVPGSRTVMVSPGLALDSEGREIILLEDTPVEVCSYAGDNDSTVVGNYLVIEYAEETMAYEKGGCAVRAEGTSVNQSTTVWGGPSRIQAQVKFSWVPFVPHPGSNQIVLARVELAEGCKTVHQIDAGARRYIGAASAATVKQYALEGEKEVAAIPAPGGAPLLVKGTVRFHVRGRQPNSVTLYLKAEELSALHYTELAAHTHSLSVEGGAGDPDTSLEHQHDPGSYTAAEVWNDTAGISQTSAHPTHGLKARMGYIGKPRELLKDLPVFFKPEPPEYPESAKGKAAFFLIEKDWPITLATVAAIPLSPIPIPVSAWIAPETDNKKTNDILWHAGGTIDGGEHHHGITGTSGNSRGSGRSALAHGHRITGSGTSGETGTYVSQPRKRARVGVPPLTFVSNLQITVDGVNKTTAIRDQIVDTVPGDQKRKWQSGLGDGTGNHPLANDAIEAVPIRLDFLPGVAFAEGQHVIEFSVGLRPGDEANGGKILYNLYVE